MSTPLMDVPIYLLQVLDEGYRWYVIEEKTANIDTVTDLHLPPLNYDVLDPCDVSMVVSNSRIFLIGGTTKLGPWTYEDNGIICIDLRNNPSWKRCVRWAPEFSCTGGAVYNNQDDHIYVLNLLDKEAVLRFNCRNIRSGEVLVVPDLRDSLLVASTHKNMLMYKPAACDSVGVPEFRFFGMMSSSSLTPPWSSFPCHHHDPKPNRFSNDHETSVVEGEGEEACVVCFCDVPPDPVCADDGDYSPGLFVYNIGRGKWLPKRVQGLPNDNVILPAFDTPFRCPSLMQVNVDKFAFVWECIAQNRETEVHWCKFNLVRTVDGYGSTIYCDSRILSRGTFPRAISHFVRCAVDAGGAPKL